MTRRTSVRPSWGRERMLQARPGRMRDGSDRGRGRADRVIAALILQVARTKPAPMERPRRPGEPLGFRRR